MFLDLLTNLLRKGENSLLALLLSKLGSAFVQGDLDVLGVRKRDALFDLDVFAYDFWNAHPIVLAGFAGHGPAQSHPLRLGGQAGLIVADLCIKVFAVSVSIALLWRTIFLLSRFTPVLIINLNGFCLAFEVLHIVLVYTQLIVLLLDFLVADSSCDLKALVPVHDFLCHQLHFTAVFPVGWRADFSFYFNFLDGALCL